LDWDRPHDDGEQGARKIERLGRDLKRPEATLTPSSMRNQLILLSIAAKNPGHAFLLTGMSGVVYKRTK
jgi:hypothetical protein